ncbi:MAG: D-alanyl-D-alanine carboxypeptidase family protein [Kofleriaceae bacterium]|nr:D-alanyl-D-alanine carboxypeptidase family protein [Kofleriaceae bacterium]
MRSLVLAGALVSALAAPVGADGRAGAPAPAPGLTVGDVARTQCTAAELRPLADQLLAEAACLRPGALVAIDDVPGLALGFNASPLLGAAAARALRAAADGARLTVYSTTRALVQQYVYHQWATRRRCPMVVVVADRPGQSRHESGLAIDTPDFAAWKDRLAAAGFRWRGRRDAVHFDYRGPGATDLRRASVRAFQRLWNRNHPHDRIGEHGRYDAATARRVARAPAAGFPLGPSCR